MNMKKVIAVIMAGVMTAGFVTGCGQSSKSKSTKDGKVQLEIFSTKPESAKTLQGLIDKFMKEHQDISISLTSQADAGTILKTRLTKNDIPDIIAMGGDATYTELQSAGVLLDLSDSGFTEKVQESYLQMVYDVNKDEEKKAYGIPYATNASGVIYNKDIFEEAGVKVPKTWTEFMEVCEKLKAAGYTPFELTYADAWCGLPAWNSMATVIPEKGFTDARKKGETTFADTHKEVMEKYLKILNYAQEGFLGTTYNDGNAAFAKGNAAMSIQGNWAISEYIKTNKDINIDMFAFPSTDKADSNTVTSGVDVLMAVSNQASEEQQEAGKKFIEFMLAQENAKQYIEEQFAFSAVKGVEQDNETVAGLKKDIAEGRVSNFPDHYYPSGYDLAAILQECALNFTNGMSEQENIAATLKLCDEQYDAANVE
ncbi:ABC transporter substrate-binding protein [Anaerosacchariphilus polymeriproducens]|uniref:Probable sugar-binding periplasmic protein n=1 Tax=Anaerosacchariphilus polymeriproducens TaxID=1812858 RepID=A0A371AUE5_9FIRM|nr:extracellular solute-binding protein [Anaerosacchariphilus polymeriproducens]RDU23193.1 extracellular solute-binding protein [Anaerosacchariphilus polymeriproducens]